MPINESIPGLMTLVDLKAVEFLASRVPESGVIVEVGSFLGRSSWTLAKSCPASATVYCVDPWEFAPGDEYKPESMLGEKEGVERSFKTFQKNTRDCPNIVPIKATSTKAAWPTDRAIDLVFIDALHQAPYVEQDIDCWLPRLQFLGVLAGHDFDTAVFPDVCRAVVTIAEKLNRPIKSFPQSTVWFIDLDAHTPLPEGAYATNDVTLSWLKEILEMDT